jgi:RHS repeat-associated protein
LLTFNTETRTFNNLNQMTRLTITGSAPLDISYNFTAGQNDGKITSQTDNLSGETVTYQYDSLNRLLSATSSQSWGETYGFDSFGNLLSKTGTGGAPTLSQSVNTATNQIVGQRYDANRNQLAGPLGGVSYDAENRVASAAGGVQYAYDSRNKRIWRSILSGGNLAQQVYVYGVDGQKIGTYTFTLGQYGETNTPEMTNSTVLLATFFGRKRVGTYDRLGSAKYNQSNNAAQSFYPYGEDRGTVEPNDELKFATYTRDAASGLDYADQRYYASNFGRFMSPDRSTRGTKGSNPGTLNGYTYVLNDPVNHNDPGGLDYCLIDGNPIPDMNDTACGEAGGEWVIDEPPPSDPGCNGNGSGFIDNGVDPEPCPTQLQPPEEEAPPPQCTMQLWTRPTDYTLPLGLIPENIWLAYIATHSYLVLTNSQTGFTTIDGLHTENQLTDEVVTNGYGNNKNQNPSNLWNFSDGPPISIPCSEIQQFINVANAFQPTTYNAAGPNSNSFMHWLLTQLGFGNTYSAPFGAWGWNTPVPGQLMLPFVGLL